MLFQRIYNWIKYKTLPPSILFKNRLFIERDSKHKRIFSNLGLTFRNSKWSNYSVPNIKNQFKTTFFKSILFGLSGLFILFILINFKKYYIFLYIFNNTIFFFWLCIDSFDYYFSFLIWILTVISSSVINTIYSYFFFINFSSRNYNLKDTKNFKEVTIRHKLLTNATPHSNLSISNHDANWILYSWINNNNSQYSNTLLDNLFFNDVNLKFWNNYYDLFIKMYKISNLCFLSSEKNSIFYLNTILNKLLKSNFKGNYYQLLSFFNNTTHLTNYSALLLNYFLNHSNNYFNKKMNSSNSLFFLNNRTEWNFNDINKELTKYNFLTHSKIGLFYLSNFNFGNLNNLLINYSEFLNLSNNLNNQFITAKWNRWLYRYSILHRKILKNSHKITLTKKLINSGFYNSTLFDKNIWASHFYSKLGKNNNFFSSLYNLEYLTSKNFNNNILSYDIFNDSNLNNFNNLFFLKFYENSYFWFIKRYYFFNTLDTNYVKSTLNILNKTNLSDVTADQRNSSIKYFTLINYLTNSNILNNSNLTHFYLTNTDANNFVEFNNNNLNVYNDKDVFLLFDDKDLLNKENLNILYWLNSPSLFNLNLLYFDYFTYFNLATPSINNTFVANNEIDSNFEYFLLLSLNNIDDIYFKDIETLTFF